MGVVTPFAGYEIIFSEGRERHEYNRLLQGASKTGVIEKHGSKKEAYLKHARECFELPYVLIAVCDGNKAAGL